MNRRTLALASLAVLPATVMTSLPATPDAAASRPGTPKAKVVTRTFSNTRRITIPTATGPASPYPSTIDVSGLRNARILDVNLELIGFSYEGYPNLVDILLVSPGGRAALVMSDVGRVNPVEDLEITLDDQAAEPLPRATLLTSGTFRPANYEPGPEAFPAPAPQGVTRSALSTFKGAKPNGWWKLFVIHDSVGYSGKISFGWSLTIKARVQVRKKRK